MHEQIITTQLQFFFSPIERLKRAQIVLCFRGAFAKSRREESHKVDLKESLNTICQKSLLHIALLKWTLLKWTLCKRTFWWIIPSVWRMIYFFAWKSHEVHGSWGGRQMSYRSLEKKLNAEKAICIVHCGHSVFIGCLLSIVLSPCLDWQCLLHTFCVSFLFWSVQLMQKTFFECASLHHRTVRQFPNCCPNGDSWPVAQYFKRATSQKHLETAAARLQMLFFLHVCFHSLFPKHGHPAQGHLNIDKSCQRRGVQMGFRKLAARKMKESHVHFAA